VTLSHRARAARRVRVYLEVAGETWALGSSVASGGSSMAASAIASRGVATTARSGPALSIAGSASKR
jgi:hypothetical protein